MELTFLNTADGEEVKPPSSSADTATAKTIAAAKYMSATALQFISYARVNRVAE